MPMHDGLLEYYKDELAYLRKMGAAFASRYPKVASRLELGPEECPDPHVERLLEAFAFLTARIQRNIDEAFPEITSALLNILYPHYLTPIPSMAIAHFAVDPTQGKLTTGHVIKPHTPLCAPSQQGPICRFRTCYPVTLWPVEITYAGFDSTARFSFLEGATNVATVLRLRLTCQSGSLAALPLRQLRLYLAGDATAAYRLYELLFGSVLRVALLPDASSRPLFLPADIIKPVGFQRAEALLPSPSHAHPGYRLLQEYFCFPEKFLFVDLEQLDVQRAQQSLDILFLLAETPRERLHIDRENFVLGCTPIINLFPKTTEPIRLDHRKTAYTLMPDLRRARTTDIHSILSVTASSSRDEDTYRVEPFYSFAHTQEGRASTAFWYARRRPTERPDLPGAEMTLSFLDLQFRPQQPATQTLYAHTLCTNRDLAAQLPAGALLHLEEAAPLAHITCLNKPTPQIEPPAHGATQWRLISHLSLNYLSLTEGRDSLQALREILRLYNFAELPSIHQQINGLRELRSRPVVRRIGQEAWRGFCRGIEVTLVFDESAYVGSSALLFAAVLRHFFALYASVNTFAQLVITSHQREGTWKQWPPMAGEQSIL
ncbi:MAG: type VI secretion system baseplate subunit TssF [Candidatus Tectimicrobiota bacterium]